MPTIQCPRCDREFHTLFDEMRFRAGSFYDPDEEESYDQVCEDCARELRQ